MRFEIWTLGCHIETYELYEINIGKLQGRCKNK